MRFLEVPSLQCVKCYQGYIPHTNKKENKITFQHPNPWLPKDEKQCEDINKEYIYSTSTFTKEIL